MSDDREALLEEIAALLAAHGIAPSDLVDALKQLPVRQYAGDEGDPEAHRLAVAEHRDELEALAAERRLVGVHADEQGRLLVLPGGTDPPDDNVLADYAAAAAAVLGHRPTVRYESWDPDGPEERVPGDATHTQRHERFHVGSHDGSITCRGCLSSFTLDHRTGEWRGRHYPLCPTAPRR